jgi:predicted GTPase
MAERKRIVIFGTPGRNYHNFNVLFRNDKGYEVVAFVEQQARNKLYPKSLSGKLYPRGIPIFHDDSLPKIIDDYKIDEVVFSCSDMSNEEVMQKASIILSSGADFRLIGPRETMLKSKRPVIAITGVRSGVGKSPVSRRICRLLKSKGISFVVVRHPVPTGSLEKMSVQKFATKSDLDKYGATLEEREEYEPLIEESNMVYSGIDYGMILKEAEKEADVIVWDGGNNDLPFIKPDLHIVVADAIRPGHELLYYPGESNLMMANVVLVNKVDTANPVDVQRVIDNIRLVNKNATIIKTVMDRSVDKPELIRSKRVVIVEDGPTLTYGGLDYGAGLIEAKNLGAFIMTPREKAVGSIRDVLIKFPQLGSVIPIMGYSRRQIEELQDTINNLDCDSVLLATPFDLRNLLMINKPVARVRYEIREIGKPDMEDVVSKFLKKM